MKELCIYISGKVTGVEPREHCEKKFEKAECELLAAGAKKVINPLKLGIQEGCTWDEAMRVCIKALEGCNAIYILSDWLESKGAQVEFELAAANGLSIYFEDHEETLVITNQIKDGVWK